MYSNEERGIGKCNVASAGGDVGGRRSIKNMMEEHLLLPPPHIKILADSFPLGPHETLDLNNK